MRGGGGCVEEERGVGERREMREEEWCVGE
jgi:hypothetical protein